MSIPNTKTDPKKVCYRQVSLYKGYYIVLIKILQDSTSTQRLELVFTGSPLNTKE